MEQGNVRPETMERITNEALANAFIEEQIKALREQIGDKKVLLALSGGVDSSVCAALISKAVGKQLKEVRDLIRQDPYSEKLNMYYVKMPFETFTADEVDKDRERFIALFDILTRWIDCQLENCEPDSAMFVVIGP